MKVFKNSQLTDPVNIEKLDLGTLEAGIEKEFEFYLLNDSMAILMGLSFSVDNSEIEIITSPQTMLANGSDILKIKCKPRVDLREPIKANIKISGKEIFG
ncbi:MAG: hypothetical protein V1901_03730 [Patescibacteria group bacterium]